MTTPVIQRSFAAGEISPGLYARGDLAKYHVGAAKMRNFFVDYRGGAANRSGTEFIGQCVNSDKPNRLIPFTFSSTQAYALVFGDRTLRILFRGAELLEVALPVLSITNALPAVVGIADHGYSNGDAVTILGVGGTTQVNGRTFIVANPGEDAIALYDLFGEPVDSTAWDAYTSGGTVARVYTLATPYAAEDLALLKFVQSADTMTIVHPSYPPQKLTRNANATWSIVDGIFSPLGEAPGNLIGETNDTFTQSNTTYRYVVTAVGANGATESRPSNIFSIQSTALSETSTDAALQIQITLAWVGVPSATAYNVYRTAEVLHGVPVPGALFGFVGTVTAGQKNSFIDNNIKPDFTNCPPQAANPFQIGAIASVPVETAGTAYTTAAVITITDPTGYGAVATPILGTSGEVTGVNILNGGQNYTDPVATIDEGTPGGLDPGLPTGGIGGGGGGGGGGSGGGDGGGGTGGGGGGVTPPDEPIPGTGTDF